MIKNFVRSKILQAFAKVHITVYCYTPSGCGEYIMYEGNLKDLFLRSKMQMQGSYFLVPSDISQSQKNFFEGKLRIKFQFIDL